MAPVPVGAKLRLGIKLLAVDDIPGGVQQTLEFAFETEGCHQTELHRRGHLPQLRMIGVHG